MASKAPRRTGSRTIADQRSERIIRTLEGIAREYRSGKTTVLDRLANPQLPDDGVDSLREVLAGVLFGERAMQPSAARGGSVICASEEYAAFQRIGEGSAHRGADLVAEAATAWVRRKPRDVARWFIAAIPKLSAAGFESYCNVGRVGFVGTQARVVLIGNPAWYDPCEIAIERVMSSRSEDDRPSADGLLRAMAVSWGTIRQGRAA